MKTKQPQTILNRALVAFERESKKEGGSLLIALAIACGIAFGMLLIKLTVWAIVKLYELAMGA